MTHAEFTRFDDTFFPGLWEQITEAIFYHFDKNTSLCVLFIMGLIILWILILEIRSLNKRIDEVIKKGKEFVEKGE